MNPKAKKLLEEHAEAVAGFCQRAYDIVVTEARRIVEAYPDDIEEFCMGMGTFFFTGKRGGKFDSHEFTDEDWDSDRIRMDSGCYMPNSFEPEFTELVDRLDCDFGVTGNPVRFKAGTKSVHDWGDTGKNPVQYEPLDG